jgi:hypothetical protein
MWDTATVPIYFGEFKRTTCTYTPKWVNPDPPTWKTVDG